MKKGTKAAPKSKDAVAREKYARAYSAWKNDQGNPEKEMAFFKITPPPPPRRGEK